MRVIINMACESCKRRNYTTMKNKKNNPERLEMKKFCPACKSMQGHKETK